MKLFAVFIPVYMLVLIGGVWSQANCPLGQDFSPCTCSNYNNLYDISCNKVPVDEVKNVFNRTINYGSLQNFFWTLSPNDDAIPGDLLGDKWFLSFFITCPSTGYSLKMDRDALKSSRGHTNSLGIYDCDISSLDFGFLSSFDSMTSLRLENSVNVHQSLPTLPALQNLESLVILKCSGLDAWVEFPELENGLRLLYLGDSPDMTDSSLSRILDWTVLSSKLTLETLKIGSNMLTTIPPQLGSFINLNVLEGSGNKNNMIVPTGSLTFNVPVSVVNLLFAQVEEIEPNAFQGDFSQAVIFLMYNQLTRFESSVFLAPLQQMNSNIYQYIDVMDNPFDCISDLCHLKWLIVDNRNLLDFVRNAKCLNGPKFVDLDPNEFINCSETGNYTTTEAELYTTTTEGETTNLN